MPNKIHYMAVLYRLKITITEAAKRIGCSRQYLSTVINGHQKSPRIDYYFEQWARGK